MSEKNMIHNHGEESACDLQVHAHLHAHADGTVHNHYHSHPGGGLPHEHGPPQAGVGGIEKPLFFVRGAGRAAQVFCAFSAKTSLA